MHLLLFLAAFVSGAFGILMLVFGGTHFLAPLAANPLIVAAVTWLLGAALLVLLGVIAARIRRLADALDAQRLPAMLTTAAPPPPAAPLPSDEAFESAIFEDPPSSHPTAAPQVAEVPPQPADIPQPAVIPTPAPPARPEATPPLAAAPPTVAPQSVASPQSTDPAPVPVADPSAMIRVPLPSPVADVLPEPATPFTGAPPSAAPPVELEPSAPAPVTTWPRIDPSDRIVPADHRAPVPPLAASAPEVSIAMDEVVVPAAVPAGPPSVLKSGVVEGMAYTLYSDGSVEAELPVGIVHFASISEWRAHIQAQA